MTIKAIYLTGAGDAEVEDIKLKKRLIEFKDGYHPTDPGAILTHREHKYPPLVFIWQGRSNMEGAMPSIDQLADFCKRTEAAKHHNRKVGISKRWVRQLISGLCVFFKLLIIFYTIGFAIILLVVFA